MEKLEKYRWMQVSYQEMIRHNFSIHGESQIVF
jgi:hypothetical protein